MTESSTVPIIRATHLGKTFRSLKRKSGFVGAIQNLFSTDYEEIKLFYPGPHQFDLEMQTAAFGWFKQTLQ